MKGPRAPYVKSLSNSRIHSVKLDHYDGHGFKPFEFLDASSPTPSRARVAEVRVIYLRLFRKGNKLAFLSTKQDDMFGTELACQFVNLFNQNGGEISLGVQDL